MGALTKQVLAHRRAATLAICAEGAKEHDTAQIVCFRQTRAVGEVLLSDGHLVLNDGSVELGPRWPKARKPWRRRPLRRTPLDTTGCAPTLVPLEASATAGPPRKGGGFHAQRHVSPMSCSALTNACAFFTVHCSRCRPNRGTCSFWHWKSLRFAVFSQVKIPAYVGASFGTKRSSGTF